MPCARLEEKLKKLGLSTEDSSVARSTPAGKHKYSFRVFFPQPPYDSIEFNALKAGSGYNFTGQLLGLGGKQLQRIKQESGARVEVVNGQGNLNGTHPNPLDPELHALVTADSLGKLQKAAELVTEALQPANGKYIPFAIIPGGSTRLIVANSAAPKAAQTKALNKHADANKAMATHQGDKASTEVLPASQYAAPSPLLTPVTPAAVHNRPSGAFSANGCNSALTTPSCYGGSPMPTSDGSYKPSIGRRRSSESSCSSNSSNIRVLYSQLEGFSLPPAAMPPPGKCSLGAEDPSEMPKSVNPNEAADASNVQVQGNEKIGQMTVLKTPVMCAAQQAVQSPAQPATRAIDSGEGIHLPAQEPFLGRRLSSLGGDWCRMSLPSALLQDLGIAADEANARSVQNSMGGALLATAAASNAVAAAAFQLPDGKSLLHYEVLAAQQQPAVLSPTPGLDSSANGCSCFDYGLGLYNSRWDRKNSTLDTLMQTHQCEQQQHRQQQEAEQMHLMQLQRRAAMLAQNSLDQVSSLAHDAQFGGMHSVSSHLQKWPGFLQGTAETPSMFNCDQSHQAAMPPRFDVAATEAAFYGVLGNPFGRDNAQLLQEQHGMLAGGLYTGEGQLQNSYVTMHNGAHRAPDELMPLRHEDMLALPNDSTPQISGRMQRQHVGTAAALGQQQEQQHTLASRHQWGQEQCHAPLMGHSMYQQF